MDSIVTLIWIDLSKEFHVICDVEFFNWILSDINQKIFYLLFISEIKHNHTGHWPDN